ncbi:MAG TPA: hypothetical protein DCP11_03845 [Microbacteriaceae bacterium]|jgi:hypothetical protein|nr:hypothetical protein [Microbacteriaceae bacterium]
MTDNTGAKERYDLPLALDSDHNLDAWEVRWLWSFIHGDIMDVQVRNRLRTHWGFCSRHAWGYAVIEIELWQAGAGKRGGHQPFDVGILYGDLLESMRGYLARGRRGSRGKTLESHGSCMACDDLRGPELAGIIVTHAGFNSLALAQEANQLTHTREWFDETRDQWTDRVCPDCATASRIGTGSHALRCRPHLIKAGAFDDDTVGSVVEHLADLQARLFALVESMTQKGRPSTPTDDASWVEALGWFHGWDFPLAVLAGGDPHPIPQAAHAPLARPSTPADA